MAKKEHFLFCSKKFPLFSGTFSRETGVQKKVRFLYKNNNNILCFIFWLHEVSPSGAHINCGRFPGANWIY